MNDAPENDAWGGANERRDAMTFKTGILAAAAAFTLAIPAIASAQPYYGGGYGPYRYAPAYRDRDDWRREEREREWRREQEMRRLQWEREHAYRGYGYNWGYGYR